MGSSRSIFTATAVNSVRIDLSVSSLTAYIPIRHREQEGSGKNIWRQQKMKMYQHKIACPNCGVNITIPILPSIEAQAKEEFDLAEQTAQGQYNTLWLWLYSASLWQLIKFWWRQRNG